MDGLGTFLQEWSPTGILGVLSFIAVWCVKIGVRFGRYTQWEEGEHAKIHEGLAELRGDVCAMRVTNHASHRVLAAGAGIDLQAIESAESQALADARTRKELRQ